VDEEFVCRYVQDWAYTQTLYAHTRKQDPIRFFWYALIPLVLALAAHYLLRGSVFFGTIYVLILLQALWKAFGGHIRLRRRWAKTCRTAGTDRIETTVTFGTQVTVADSSGVRMEFPWARFEKLCLRESGPYLRFSGDRRRDGRLYIPRAGFADGTGEAFLAWIAAEHPALLHK